MSAIARRSPKISQVVTEFQIYESPVKIFPLGVQHTEDVIQIIAAAFERYPLMNFFFDDIDRRSIEAIGQYICDLATINDSLLLGALVRDELQGVIYATPPEINKNKDENAIHNLEAKLARSLSGEALERMDLYSQLKDANKPSQPHFYINMLGVDPNCQGIGIGKKLLAYIHTLSGNHSKSDGVALDTQTQSNVAYYQNLGYQVSSTANLDRLKNWFMLRAEV